jgi:hypothetical protein
MSGVDSKSTDVPEDLDRENQEDGRALITRKEGEPNERAFEGD